MTTGLTHEESGRAARAELRRGQALLRTDPREALGHLKEGRRLDPRDPEISAHLARVEVRLSRYSDALESLRRFLALAGPEDEALSLAALCHFRLGEQGQALARARAALVLNDSNQMAREIGADCLRAQGAWRAASEEIRILLAYRGLDGRVQARLRLKLAQCLLRLGEAAEAWRLTQSLLRSGYDDARVKAVHAESEALGRSKLREALSLSGPMREILLWAAGPRLLRILFSGRNRNKGEEAGLPASLPTEKT